MAIQVTETIGGKTIEVCVTGKLRHEDYKTLVPEFERLLRDNGKISVLFEMLDFHGWEPGALWDEIKEDVKHFNRIEKLAMVGDKKWEKEMSTFCKPFTTAEVRYFDLNDLAQARAWVERN